MKLKKIILTIMLFSLFTTTNAYDKNRQIAEDYIKEYSNFGPFWTNNPKIVSQTYFYNSDDNNPSYIEYKVSCDDTVDCGYIMLNIDGTDVEVPISSYSGKTQSEIMKEKGNLSINSKNYYFDIFESFAIDQITGNIGYTNPDNDSLLKQDEHNKTFRDAFQKESLLENKLNELKNIAIETKQEKIKNQILLNSSTRYIGPYVNTSNGSGMINTTLFDEKTCRSLTPCYKQEEVNYPSYRCEVANCNGVSGCGPTAWSIVFGYYDKFGGIDIIDGITPAISTPTSDDTRIKDLQKDLGGLLFTRLKSNGGGTNEHALRNGAKYLNGRFINDLDQDAPLIGVINKNFYDRIKNEINTGRPVIMGYKYPNGTGHIVVVQGYNKNKLSINFGQGPDSAAVLVDINTNTHKFSTNIINANGNLVTESGIVDYIVIFKIKK